MSRTSGFTTRLSALLRKEIRQMLRDRSTLLVGLMLPVALILLFGYGLTFDVKNAPVAVVSEDPSLATRELVSGLTGSPYLSTVVVTDMAQATDMMRTHTVSAIVRIPSDFSQRLARSEGQIQLILNGADTTTASAIESYVGGAVQTSLLKQAEQNATAGGGLTIVQRMWFNEAANSTWYLVPGLIVLVMTLIGAFLTSLLIAREWERGTLEALFVTPVRPVELVLAKLAPYILIGAIDLGFCLLSAQFLFHVPMRGPLILIILTSLLYLTVTLLLGLFISGTTRNQFAASQMALLTSFMPAMMLSGFVYDLRNVPVIIQIVSQLLPATHFMQLIKSLFLGGISWTLVVRDCAILIGYALVLGLLTTRTLRKRLN